LCRFVFEAIDSVEQLEVLLLLRKHPERSWGGGDVSRALYTHPLAAARRLTALHAQGLLTSETVGPDVRFRYAPSSPERAEVVDRLAALYKERRVAVTTLIYSKPPDQVQAFADAFRLRKKED
jgi:hypothetical protein